MNPAAPRAQPGLRPPAWLRPGAEPRSATLVVCAALAAAGCAPDAAGGGAAGGSSPQQAAGLQAQLAGALRLVDPAPARLGLEVVVRPRRDRRVRAEVDLDARRITVFADRRDAPHATAHDIAHETGHAIDAERMTDTLRRAYLRRRGAPAARWWPQALSDYRSGAGDFAEVYALCHSASPEFRSRLAPRPPDPCSALPPVARQAAGPVARGAR